MSTARADAAAIAVELHRLVPAAHLAARPHAAPLLVDARPHGGLLVDLRTLLLAGPVPIAQVHAVRRYAPDPGVEHIALEAAGFLTTDADTDTHTGAAAGAGTGAPGDRAVHATDRCRAVLTEVLAVLDAVCTDLWGTPTTALSLAEAAVARLDTAFAAAGHPGHGTPANRLFTALCAIRYHRADLHAAAWAAEGHTADTVRALPADDPVRVRIEQATDDNAARPLGDAEQRAALLTALRELPGDPQALVDQR